jgi:D-tyrosyl-tRNA(Tyr) deacylase
MRAVLQRVSSASVISNGNLTGEISIGFLVLLGIEVQDELSVVEWLTDKIKMMRVFQVAEDKMNLAL